jgi:hypothetical protein
MLTSRTGQIDYQRIGPYICASGALGRKSAHGTPLCQGPALGGLRLRSAGPGTWLVRRAGVRGQAGHAGVSSRPRLPARARFASFLVGEHAGEDDVGQPPLQGAHGHHGRHAAGPALVVIGAALGLVPQLHDRHDVQDPVDAPVPGARQPVAGLAAGGGVQRRGAVPGGEPVAAGEPVDVADVGEQPGGPDGPMPCRSIRVDPRAVTSSVSSLSRARVFLSMASSSPASSAASRRRVLPARSRGLTVASSVRACRAETVPVACPSERRTRVIRGHSRAKPIPADLHRRCSAEPPPEPSKLVVPAACRAVGSSPSPGDSVAPFTATAREG